MALGSLFQVMITADLSQRPPEQEYSWRLQNQVSFRFPFVIFVDFPSSRFVVFLRS